jgi:hypothetical protein
VGYYILQHCECRLVPDVLDVPDVWPDGMGGRRGGRGRGGWLDGKGRARRGRWEGWPDGGGGGGGVPDGMEGGVPDGDLWKPDGMGGCPNGKDVRTKGKGETGSLDHVRMRYIGSCGASSCSSSVESFVLSSLSCSGNPLCRYKTSFPMTILLVH